MNPREENLRALLDEVLPSSADQCGPDQSCILAMARREQSRRRQKRATVGTIAAVAILASLAFRSAPPQPTSSPAIAQVADAPSLTAPAPLEIHAIDDDQLFTLLQSTPSAIMEWPNGDRAVLVVTAGEQ